LRYLTWWSLLIGSKRKLASVPAVEQVVRRLLLLAALEVGNLRAVRVVALQVEFERQTLKPVFHLIGYRL
jgi:hypothetical protein